MTLFPLVLDFEATTEVIPRELTEIGAVMLSPDTFAPVREFQSYIRPTLHPQLSDHCKRVTGFTQATVNAATPFTDVWNRFLEWMEDEPLSGVVLCGWGPFEWWWLRDECALRSLRAPPFTRYVDLMAEAARHFASTDPTYTHEFIGLTKAAERLRLPVDTGQLHGAQYDAQLAARVLQAVMIRPLPPDIGIVHQILQEISPDPLDARRLEAELRRRKLGALAIQAASAKRFPFGFMGTKAALWRELWFQELLRRGMAVGTEESIQWAETLPRAFAQSEVRLQPKLMGPTIEVRSNRPLPPYVPRTGIPRPTLEPRRLPSLPLWVTPPSRPPPPPDR